LSNAAKNERVGLPFFVPEAGRAFVSRVGSTEAWRTEVVRVVGLATLLTMTFLRWGTGGLRSG